MIDVAKGVEEQTEKLVEVCRMRSTPIMVFVNKLDRMGKDAFDLLDEIPIPSIFHGLPMDALDSINSRVGAYDLFRRHQDYTEKHSSLPARVQLVLGSALEVNHLTKVRE